MLSNSQKLLGNKNHLGRRYLIFLIGLFVCSFGVAFATMAGLGTSPISSIPYTLSLIFTKISFGEWAIIFGVLQIAAQAVLLWKRIAVSELLMQAVPSFAFGYFVDFSLLVLEGFAPEGYVQQFLFLLLGCAILAFGVYLELLADVTMLAGDAINKAIAIVTKKEYGNVKIATDIAMCGISAILALVCLHRLVGVREGTLVAARIVGSIIKFYQKLFRPLADRILPDNKPQ